MEDGEEEDELNLSEEVVVDDIQRCWLCRTPDEEIAALLGLLLVLLLLSSFKIALESLSDDPSFKSGKRVAPTDPLLFLKLS